MEESGSEGKEGGVDVKLFSVLERLKMVMGFG